MLVLLLPLLQMTFLKTPLSHHLLWEVSLGPKAA